MEASITVLPRLLSERGRCTLRRRRPRIMPSRTSTARRARRSLPSRLRRRGRGFKMRLKQRQIPSRRPGRLHRRGVEQRGCLEERVRQKILLLSLRDRRDHMRQEKLSPFHGNEGSAGSHARGQTATSLRKGLLQLWEGGFSGGGTLKDPSPTR